jgi:hypothetical protein
MHDKAFGHNALLPEEIRDVFMWLCQELASLNSKWQFYLALYTGEEETGLLSELASGSFSIIEESVRTDLTMSICRLSDPARTAGAKPNLSLETLAKKCQALDGPDDLGELVEQFLEACQPVRRHRNKLVAHRDLNTTIKPQDNPLPGIGAAQVDLILDLAGRVLNLVHRHFGVDSELSFKPFLTGGADTLLYWLRLAREAQQARLPN